MRGLARILCCGALLACASGGIAIAVPASAEGNSYSPYNETASSALARYLRTLAQDPKDFDSLIGAGRAALEIGDTEAAAGFFARADEVDPRSPLPQAGMGAVLADNGNAKAAMPYFTRALQLGATQATIACDRGLAYDLLGQQAKAQAVYRVALSGPDADEARRIGRRRGEDGDTGVERRRVGGDDLAAETLGEQAGDGGLARGGRAVERDDATT